MNPFARVSVIYSIFPLYVSKIITRHKIEGWYNILLDWLLKSKENNISRYGENNYGKNGKLEYL